MRFWITMAASGFLTNFIVSNLTFGQLVLMGIVIGTVYHCGAKEGEERAHVESQEL